MNSKLIAGLYILLALGAGLYAILGLSGNQSVETANNNSSITASCKQSLARGEALDPIAVGQVAAFRAINEPLDMRQIAFKDADGNPKTIADWQGKTVLFNLWATWCPPCREEMPYFETLQSTKADDSFQVVPVSIDIGTPDKPKKFYDETGLKELPFFHDSSMNAFQTLREKGVALGMPTTLLIDTNGCALGVLNGPAHWASDDALKLIDAAIGLVPLG